MCIKNIGVYHSFEKIEPQRFFKKPFLVIKLQGKSLRYKWHLLLSHPVSDQENINETIMVAMLLCTVYCFVSYSPLSFI